ncbi:hypothetical protein AKJ16_DCAP17247 [Drosera capensis]
MERFPFSYCLSLFGFSGFCTCGSGGGRGQVVAFLDTTHLWKKMVPMDNVILIIRVSVLLDLFSGLVDV